MSRGESYGGGQSSLGYLFGSEQPRVESTPPSNITPLPPYATEDNIKPPSASASASSHPNSSSTTNTYSPRPQPQHLGNFLTDRPSTKVNSVPGGDSSLGYLFGDK